MTALSSTIVAYVVVGGLLWGYVAVLLVQCLRQGRKQDQL